MCGASSQIKHSPPAFIAAFCATERAPGKWMVPSPLRMKLELTSPNEPAAARLQPHACIDEIKQKKVFDVAG